MKKKECKNMESVFLKKDVQKISRQKEEIVELKLPKLEYSELKKLENQLFEAGAKYDEWEISAAESKDGKVHKGKSWYVIKNVETDMTIFEDYIEKNEQTIEKTQKRGRKTSREYDKARKKNKRISFRVTEEEDKILKEKIAESNLTMSDYIVKKGIEGIIVIQELKSLSDLAKKINKVGVHINDIARKVNSNGFVTSEDIKKVKEYLEEIREMTEEVV